MSEEREPAVERVIESNRIFEGRICALRVDTVELDGGEIKDAKSVAGILLAARRLLD